MNTLTHSEFLAEAKRRFGPNAAQWQFVCPACGTVQSMQDFHDLGVKEAQAHNAIAFSCIGRFKRMGDEGIAARRRGEPWQKGCNWTLGGLLKIHELEVVIKDAQGKPFHRPTFELATAGARSIAPQESPSTRSDAPRSDNPKLETQNL